MATGLAWLRFELTVNKRIQELICHRLRRHVRHRLQAVVDIQRRDHHEETIGVDRAHERSDDKRIPGFMSIIDKRIDGVTDEKRNSDDVKILEGNCIVFLSLFFRVGQDMLILEGDAVRNEGSGRCWTNTYIDDFGDLPELNHDTHACWC
jgi:hypothetical protein